LDILKKQAAEVTGLLQENPKTDPNMVTTVRGENEHLRSENSQRLIITKRKSKTSLVMGVRFGKP